MRSRFPWAVLALATLVLPLATAAFAQICQAELAADFDGAR